MEGVVNEFVGGLRAGMGLAGVASIPELREKGMFGHISAAGQREARPHIADVGEITNSQYTGVGG